MKKVKQHEEGSNYFEPELIGQRLHAQGIFYRVGCTFAEIVTLLTGAASFRHNFLNDNFTVKTGFAIFDAELPETTTDPSRNAILVGFRRSIIM